MIASELGVVMLTSRCPIVVRVSGWTLTRVLAVSAFLVLGWTTASAQAIVVTDFAKTSDRAAALDVRHDGSILAAGSTSCEAVINCRTDFAIAKYTSAGLLDGSFSGDGLQTADLGAAAGDAATSIVTQDDGRILVAGITEGPCPAECGGRLALARFTANGSLDPTFSGDGRLISSFPAGFQLNTAQADSIAIQPDGTITAVGSLNGDFAVARYTSAGVLDSSFSGDGLQTTDFGQNDTAYAAQGLSTGDTGDLAVVGSTGMCTDTSCNMDVAVAKYDPSGNLITGFSGDGKATVDFGGADNAAAVAREYDNSLVVVGSSGCTGCSRALVAAHLTLGGDLDYSFAGAARAVTEFPGGATPGAVLIQPDGKIVAGGSIGEQGAQDFGFVRLNPTGSVDDAFGVHGITKTDVLPDDRFAALAIDDQGRLIAAGDTTPDCEDLACPDDFLLVRYLPNGSVDPTFPPPPPSPPAPPAPATKPAATQLPRFVPTFAVHTRRGAHGTLGEIRGITALKGVPATSRVAVRCIRGCSRSFKKAARWGGSKTRIRFSLRVTAKTVLSVTVTAPSGATRTEKFRFRLGRHGLAAHEVKP